MATSTRVVPGSGGGGAVSASTISCVWCTITSMWRDARRMDVMLKGCSPNCVIRSARSGASSPSARSAYAACSACGGARGYQGRVGDRCKGSGCELTASTSAVIVVPSAPCAMPSTEAAACKCAEQVQRRWKDGGESVKRQMQRVNGRMKGEC